MTSPIETNNVVERLRTDSNCLVHARAMALQPAGPSQVETVQITARESEIIKRDLDEAADLIQSLSDRIDVLEGQLVVAYRLGWGAGFRCGGDMTIPTPSDDELDAQARAALTQEGKG